MQYSAAKWAEIHSPFLNVLTALLLFHYPGDHVIFHARRAEIHPPFLNVLTALFAQADRVAAGR
jgi:hypothetical protein